MSTWRPIMYSPDMALAKVKGKKTQTRRMTGLEAVNFCPEDWQFVGQEGELFKFQSKLGETVSLKCPYGIAGDYLWGREKYRINDVPTGHKYIHYAGCKIYMNADFETWKPAIHMPKEACRIFDKVIRTYPQRIKEISPTDCIAEGIEPVRGTTQWKNYLEDGNRCFLPKHSFQTLWDKINLKVKPIKRKKQILCYVVYHLEFNQESISMYNRGTWDGKPLHHIINPWVWVIETEPIPQPENWPNV